MTYVEFFDRIAVENICACLTYTPERVICLGDDSKLMKAHIANYQKVFEARGQTIEFIPMTVSRTNLEKAVELLSRLVETYDDIAFDITGGEEILAVALGIVYARYPEKNIQIHRFNLKNNVLSDCDKDGKTVFEAVPRLSIEENIRIYGGEIVYGDIDEEKTYCWDLHSAFLRDVDRLWQICIHDPRYWNSQIGIFDAAQKVGTLSEDGLTVVARIFDVERELKKDKAKYKIAKGMIGRLMRGGFLTQFEDDGEFVSVSFKNKQIRRLLTKAGQVLEMKVFTLASSLQRKDGSPVYNDALNGVVIDWDGTLHEESEKQYDTKNEIDVFLMHDTVPLFVSCKNGNVEMEELFKLATVAERFGGPYAKKVLVTTSLDAMGDRGMYIRRRADDMGIVRVEPDRDMDDEAIAKLLRNLHSAK